MMDGSAHYTKPGFVFLITYTYTIYDSENLADQSRVAEKEIFPGHMTLLRRWININDVDSTSQQRRVPMWGRWYTYFSEQLL